MKRLDTLFRHVRKRYTVSVLLSTETINDTWCTGRLEVAEPDAVAGEGHWTRRIFETEGESEVLMMYELLRMALDAPKGK